MPMTEVAWEATDSGKQVARSASGYCLIVAWDGDYCCAFWEIPGTDERGMALDEDEAKRAAVDAAEGL